jgi:Lon protease-like protein
MAAAGPPPEVGLPSAVELPLFPLQAVLFPGGRLSLRIFEPRYLDLVRRCGRSGEGFGICLIVDGEEVGAPATPANVGTEAMIVDFAMTEDGLLALTVEGRRRFRIVATRVLHDGLVDADVQFLDEAARQPPHAEHALLSVLLARIMDKAGIEHAGPGKGDLADAAYVAWRLAEWLPLADEERQRMLELDDPHARLQVLVDRLPDFQPD